MICRDEHGLLAQTHAHVSSRYVCDGLSVAQYAHPIESNTLLNRLIRTGKRTNHSE